MKIKLSYGKFLKIEDCPTGSMIEVPEKCTVRDLLVLLKLPYYLQKSIIARVNGEPVWMATELAENDTIWLLRTIGGG